VIKTDIYETKEELQTLFSGQKNLIFSLLPPLFFVIINIIFGFNVAMWSSLVLAALIAILRIVRGQSVISSLGGIAGVIVAIGLSKLMGSNESFFLPGIIGSVFWVVAFSISLVFKRPIIAWGSYFLRRWPLEWYWHPRIRPAYIEVTIVWLSILAIRLYFQIFFYFNQAADELAIVSLLTGTPATIALLVFSYLYGKRRLNQLSGPTVQDLQSGIQAPWTSQHTGF